MSSPQDFNVMRRWPQLCARRQVRVSRLDILDKKSSVHQTDLIGLLRLTHMVAGVWLVTSPICTYYDTGRFFDAELLESAFSDLDILFTTWLYAVIYSFTGYGLHLLHAKGKWPRSVVKALLFLDTTILMSTCLTIVRAVNWSVYPSVFIMSVAVIHLMKIHSFVDTGLYFAKLASSSESTGGHMLDERRNNEATVQSNASVTTTPDGCLSEQNENLIKNRCDGVDSSVSSLDANEATSRYKDEYCDPMSFSNFAKFLIVPRLVYEPEWPKDPHPFRFKYFFLKFGLMLSTLALIFLVSANFVLPVMKRAHKTTYIHTFAGLIVPLFLLDLLFFYVMFECILNMLAELTGYGDRDFYQDWWNSTTWEEFARKWNYPVHEFLLRHIYLPIYTNKTVKKDTISADVQRKWMASTVTILYSAIIHEFFLAATLGFVSWYLIIIMLGQLPLFALSRYHRNTTFGNLYFCLGISVGIPFIAMLYGTDWSAKNYHNTTEIIAH